MDQGAVPQCQERQRTAPCQLTIRERREQEDDYSIVGLFVDSSQSSRLEIQGGEKITNQRPFLAFLVLLAY